MFSIVMRVLDPRIHRKSFLCRMMDCIGPRACPRSALIKCLNSGKPELRCQVGNDPRDQNQRSLTVTVSPGRSGAISGAFCRDVTPIDERLTSKS